MLGLGVWQMAAGAETEQAVGYALEVGYRHIDTASLYRNEQSVGAALKRSGLPRDEVFITTKLMPTHPSAARALAKSLERLNLDYVDLYLIHWPIPLLSRRYWREFESLQDRGLTREIGVSNFGVKELEALRSKAQRYPRSTRCNSARTTTAAGCSTTAWNTASCSRRIARSSVDRASATRRSPASPSESAAVRHR